MPIARFELPDGRIGRFEVPEGTTPEQAVSLISSNLSSLMPKEESAPAPGITALSVPDNQLVKVPAESPAPAQTQPAASQPWWAPFAASAQGEAQIGKELGPKVFGGNLAQDIFAAAKSTPAYAAAATQSLVGGNTPEDLTSQTDWKNDAIAKARQLSKENAKDPSLQDEYILGITRQKVRELPQNAMFSVLSMGAGLAGAAAGMVGGPGGAFAGGTAASGLAAYRMDTNGFLRDIRENLDEASMKATGKPLTDAQWLKTAKEYDGLVKEHGLWEALPEALGNAVGAKLGSVIFKEAGQGLIGALKSFGATALEFGTELGTETVTQTGQHNTEVKAGLSDQPLRSFTDPEDIQKSAKEVLPDVMLLSGAVAGGAHIAGKVYNQTDYAKNKQIADAIKQQVDATNFTPEGIHKEVIDRLDPNQYHNELIQPEGAAKKPELPTLTAQAPAPEEAAQVPPSESQDTQAMLDELSGKNIEEAPAEPKAEEPKPKNKSFVPVAFRYSLLESPSYDLPPLSAEDADFELESLEESAKRGRMSPGRFAQSEIGKRLDTVQMMQINEGLRLDPVKTIQELRNNISQAAPQPGPIAKPDLEAPKVKEEPKTLDDHVNDFANKIYELGVKKEPDLQEMNPEEAKRNIKEVLLDSIKEHGKIEDKFFEDIASVGIDQKQIEDFNKSIKPLVPALEAPKAEEKPETPKAPEVKPKIGVFESAITPLPVLDQISKTAIKAIETANDYAQQLTDSMPNAKDPDAHQNAIDRLNNTSNDINEKGQIVAEESSRRNNKTPGEQNRAILAAQKDLNKALIEHRKAVLAARKLVGNIKTKEAKPQVRKVRPAIEDLPYPKTQEQMDLEERNKDLEAARRKKARLQKEGGLFGALRKSLSLSEIKNISPENHFLQLKSPNDKGRLVDIVSGSAIEDYLPHEMRYKSPTFDPQQSEQYIIEKLQSGKYMTYDAEQEIERLTGDIDYIEGNIKELEDLVKEQLELKDVNLLIEEAADEQRRADQANQVYEPEHEAGVSEPGENELALKSETPDEVRAKERAKEERAKAEREAEARAKANEGVSDFTLTGSDRPADQAAARGQEDLFGQPKVEAKPAEMGALNDKIHDAVEKKSQEFLPGDHVTLGTVPGIVLGVEGDYVKFKPDSATNPKAYQRVPAKSLSFEFRPGREPKASASKASDKETGTEKGKLNADMGGLIKLLGANMYAANIADVSVKELLQNAFDASKAAVKLGIVKVGKIDIVVNAADRTITVKDNARGMTPSIVKDAFFTVAGSDKSDLDPKERSGGLGLAKMGFMLGSERLKLDTVRDGIRTTVDTDSQAIADSKFDIKKTKAPEKEHGTSVTVTIPENYTDPKTGEQKGIWFPWSIESLDALTQPLVGPVEVNVDFNGEKETLPIGVNFNQDKMPKLTTVHFSWGDADVYFGVDRKESSGYTNRPNHKVLSSGVYQFRHDFPLSQSEIIPYDILVNVKPDVDAKHPDYPFENSRERFKGRIEEDIKSLGQYLKQVAMGNEARDLQENFKGIVSMPRLEVGSEIADASKKLKKAFDTRNVGGENKFELPPVPREIFVGDGFVKTKSGEELVKPKDNKKESTFTAEKKAPEMADFMVNMKQDPKLPIFHNNTNVDYLEVGRPYGDPEKFFAEMGTLLVEMKEDLSKSGLYKYDSLKPENLFFGGISIDKKYGGVHIKVPYKGVFVNPFYDFGAKTLAGVRETILNTMIHEIAHTGSMSHGVEHNGEMIRVANYLADTSMMDYYRDALMDILVRNESAFAAMKEAYGKSTTQNTSKSLEDYGKSSASSTSGPAKGVGVNQPSAVQAGGRQGSLLPVPTAGQAGGPGQVNQGGGGTPIGPQGQLFPGLPPPKRNIYGKPVGNSRWELEPETKIGHLIDTIDHAIVDKHVDTRKVQAAIKKSIGAIDDAFNVYMKEELYHGRTANAIKDFLHNELDPVISDAIKENITLDEIEQYLHNRTAEERNDAIAKINDRFSDVDKNPGSGITTTAARAYLANLDDVKKAKLEKIAAKIDKIIKKTQQILVDNGLETQDVIDNWNNAYEHYVPLMRDQEELDFKHHGSGLGKGFQVKGSASKRAYGSTKTVVDILANIAMQRESAIIRSEKARIGRALYGLALKNPNPDFWLPVNPDAIKDKTALYRELVSMGLPVNVAQNFIQEPTTPSIDPVTGKVVYRINAALRNSDNVFPVRINGKDRYVFFNTKDEKAMRMAASLSNLDPQTLGNVLGTTALLTRWFASVNTQFNPVFGVINFARDTQGAILNLTNTPLAGKQKEVLKNIFPAMVGIYMNERLARQDKESATYWSNLFNEFRRAGGTTGYREAFARGSFSGKDTTIIEREWKKKTEGAAMKKARYVFDLLSDYNDAMENAVRLAVYKVARDMNISEDRAASLGKNITVNFNRKGHMTPVLSALYAFFSPAVQGTIMVGKTLSGPAGRKIIAGGLAVGVVQALMMARAGFDADEPPDYVRDKNFIIPLGNKKYQTLPMPQGFNVLPGVARIATEYILAKNHAITGKRDMPDVIAQVATLFADAFNPLGGGSLLQMVSPTVIDPFAAVATNKDAFGRPIYKEDMATKPTPGFMRSRENASTISQAVAHFLNYISSPAGTQFTKGKISPTADELDYYAGQIGGGAVREAIKAGEVLKAPFTSEPLPSYRVPLVGRFYGNALSPSAIQDKFYNNITLMNQYGNEIKNLQSSNQDPSLFMRKNPAARLYMAANDVNNQVNKMNQEKKAMLQNKIPLSQVRQIEAAKVDIMKRFNDQVAQIQRQR